MTPTKVSFNIIIVTCLVPLLASPLDGQELLVNGHFRSVSPQSVPHAWRIWQPDWVPARCQIAYASKGVRISAGQTPYSIGGIYQDIDSIRAGQAYRIQVQGKIQEVADPHQSLLIRVTWRQKGKALHPAGMLVQGPELQGERVSFADVLIAPPGADSAQLALETKWLKRGTVTWQQASMQPVPMPAPRTVKIGTVFLRPRQSTPEKNLELWCAQIDEAGKLGLDIVCLGEVITKVGTTASSADCAKPIPGPITERLGQAARAHGIWIVAGLTERHCKELYNTAVLLDRQGQLAGTYRKVHLPREEWKQGIRPGHSYPVFKTDFGIIAMEICYDWFFPETEAIFAQQGAEIIFAPTWGNTLPDADGCVDGESSFRVRARDNGVYMVPSVYSGNSLVIDPRGRILASSQGRTGVFWAEVDLNQREPLPWVGHWRSIGPRHRRHDTFAPLSRPGQQSGALDR